jgi:hypothetical protein
MLAARSVTAATVMVKLWVAVCLADVPLSVAVTENVDVPTAVGVPLMVPADESSASSGGRLRSAGRCLVAAAGPGSYSRLP